MGKHTIFLRNALFTTPGEASHVPVGATVIDGDVTDFGAAALTVRCERFLDDRGRVLPEKRVVIVLPWAKVDHVHIKD